MSVGRLCLNLFSSDITWNWLPSDSSLILVSEDSEEEESDDEKNQEDERLRCLRFSL